MQKGDTLIAFDRNTIAQLKANYDNVQKNYDRSKELLKNQVIDQKILTILSCSIQVRKQIMKQVCIVC